MIGDAGETAALVRRREASAREVCETALAAAEVDELGCFWEIGAARARADADAVDEALRRGDPAGALTGVPVAVKDCFDVEGLRTTVGVRRQTPLEPASRDAEAVAALRAAGAIVVGKAAMHQLAWGMSGQSPGLPPCRNPRDPGRMPGGSSSGSAAAVAAGIVPLALGTDAGDSVRQPAAWCGIVGLKPTFATIPLGGCAPMAPSLDTGGLLARSVADCGLALGVFDRGSPGRATSLPRIGVLESAFDGAEEAGVAVACRAALTALAESGAKLVELDLPWERRALGPVYAAELAHRWEGEVDGEPDAFGLDVRAGVEAGRGISAIDYLDSLAALRRMREQAARGRRERRRARLPDLRHGRTAARRRGRRHAGRTKHAALQRARLACDLDSGRVRGRAAGRPHARRAPRP